MSTALVEVRAIVRREMLDRIVRKLKQSGVPRLTVSHVHAIGAGADPDAAKFSLEEGSAYADKALVQFICGSESSGELVQLICRAACTGRCGDGIVYVLPVQSATKIRTGIEGAPALR